MQVINVYKYVRPDGGVTVSPVEPTCEYTRMVRLVADEDKALTLDGTSLTISADVNSTDGWYEVDAPADYSDEATGEEFLNMISEAM